MPQENQVLRCFSCETFQVHIVKKAKKWECKICGAKQSFKRHYGKGTGKDCRNHVMKLNELRATKSPSEIEDETLEEIPPESEPVPAVKKTVSKWMQYLDEDTDGEDYKPEKKRKLREDEDIGSTCKEADADNNLDVAGTTKQANNLQAEDSPKRKTSKNIFDSGSDNLEDVLDFI